MREQKAKTLLKDTTAYTIGLILKFHHESILQYSEHVLGIMCEALKEKPRVANNAAWAIHNFACSFQKENNNPLNSHFHIVIQMLLVASDRPDADEANLKTKVYEAINVLITVSSPHLSNSIEELLKLFLERLESIRDFTKPSAKQLQSLLCSSVQVITNKLSTRVKPYTDRIMTLIYRFFKSNAGNSDLHEEAFMIVSAIAQYIGHDFVKYMGDFHECLYIGLSNFQEYQVCQSAVGVVGDIARAIKSQLMPYCDKILFLLLQNLGKPELNKAIKPTIITCIGDIAVAIGSLFSKHFDVVMNMLKQAGDTVIQANLAEAEDREELIDYLNSLRESIFEAYTGIFQSLGSSKSNEKILPHLINTILPLVNNVYSDNTHSEEVAAAAIGLLGDIANSLGQRVKSTLSQPLIIRLIEETKVKSELAETKETCDFAKKAIQGHP